jgi:ABC-type antimicrobial peptide transport system permease subunit
MNVNTTLLLKMQSKVYGIKIIGLFGKDPSETWVMQNPTLYVKDEFLKNVKEKFIDQRRILVDLEPGVDPVWFKETVENLDPDVERVDMTEIYKENAVCNVYLAGRRRVDELGSYVSAIVASVGIVLVVSTIIRSRIKEFTIMSIRGYSPRQLAISLLVDNLGMDLLAILLGLFVGYVSLVGTTEIFNATLMVGITRKVVFPFSAQLRLSIIIGLLLASTIIPILVAVNRISKNPDLKLEE